MSNGSYSCNGAHLRDPSLKCDGDRWGGCKWHHTGKYECHHEGRIICEDCEADVSARSESRMLAALRDEREKWRAIADRMAEALSAWVALRDGSVEIITAEGRLRLIDATSRAALAAYDAAKGET